MEYDSEPDGSGKIQHQFAFHYLNVCLSSAGSVRNKSACGGITIQHACALLYSLAAEHKIMAHFKG